MSNFTNKILATLMALLFGMQTFAANDFNQNRTDFRDESIYFMITTRFYDGDPGNNVLCWDNQEEQKKTKDPCWRGDFQGVIDKLDYIKALGFTAIWITPIVQNASGYDYHGYHAMDFSHVDCRYQDSKDPSKTGGVMFQELIDKAHKKGIKIILDIVLNHTGNFGEEHFLKEFTRNTKLRNQANIDACMIPDLNVLGSTYLQNEDTQYHTRLALMKNMDGKNTDSHNYWHHLGNNWNYDLPNRWWGQIAGDCVDLNTENDAVAEYLVQCYGKFIEMGVDGFRIDTSGHISRLTFNKVFIPQFAALGEKYKDKRLNQAPFFMYGEVCARFGDVQYRGQDCLSPYFYTWKSPQNLIDQWDGSQTYWDSQVIYETGGGYDDKQMKLCEQDEADSPTSDNTFMVNDAWHEPDYSQSSGYNVIDFPLHYNFSSASSAYGLACKGDKKYNDATYNVVYVDSHDYGPQPNDKVRFGGSDAQWAENLSLMFTFRGIPCLYYGSEVGFRRGSMIDNGPNGPLSNTGRAYFGGYITGDVKATDFGEYTATGNAAASLNHDLAQHLIRLNKIRQAVPALRKGQWTSDHCTANGGIAFKRAYKDSYALVALNGGATFTNCPNGTYTDVVTGQTYSGSTITVDAPHTQGQVRVLVKDWKGGKIGEDGPFIYASAAQHKGNQTYDGNEEAGTDQFYTKEDAVESASVTFNPAGGSFRTETVTVTATLADDAKSGWYQIDGQDKVTLAPGESKQFTIGADMQFNATKVVKWGAVNEEGDNNSGEVTYKKIDPHAVTTVYVKADKAPYMYVWTENPKTEPNGAWPGKILTQKENIGGTDYYVYTMLEQKTFNFILNGGNNAPKTEDITGIESDVCYEYDGGKIAKQIDLPVQAARVTLSPNGGNFENTITVKATLSSDAKSGWYKIGNGNQVSLTAGQSASFTLGADMMEGESKTVTWSATSNDGNTKTGSATFTKAAKQPEPQFYAYFLAPANWPKVMAWVWIDDGANYTGGTWPGVDCVKTGEQRNGMDVWMWKYNGTETATPGKIIFNNGNSGNDNQTVDMLFVNGACYDKDGKTDIVISGINGVNVESDTHKCVIYDLNGHRVAEVKSVSDAEYILRSGIYVANGRKVVIK